MVYAAFIREVNKGAKQSIVAFDSTSQRQGCVIYLGSKDKTIFVPFKLITARKPEVITFLQTKILGGLPDKAHLIIALRDGVLTLENEAIP